MTKRSAVIIYSWLVVLTLIEVGLVMSGVDKAVSAIIITSTTLAKTMMIGLSLMHIRHDRPIAWLLPAIPVVLAIGFVLALFPDLVYHLPLKFQ